MSYRKKFLNVINEIVYANHLIIIILICVINSSIYRHNISRKLTCFKNYLFCYIRYCDAEYFNTGIREITRETSRRQSVFTIGLPRARRSEGRGLHAVEGVYRANTSGQLGVFGARAFVCPAKQDIIIRTSHASLSLFLSRDTVDRWTKREKDLFSSSFYKVCQKSTVGYSFLKGF